MKHYKSIGVKYWKSYFKDLKPFDTLDIEEVLLKNKQTLLSFDECKVEEGKGRYFLRISKEQLSEPRVKSLHTKFNHKNTNINDLQIIKFEGYGERVFTQEYSNEYLINEVPNFQLRDGKITPGFGTWNWQEYFKNVDKGLTPRENIYLEIPHSIINDNLATLEGTDVVIIKKFIDEIENTDASWEDIENVNKVIKKYDSIWKDWNFNFPILSYISVKRDGLLFPILGAISPNGLPGNGLHRFALSAFAKSDVPFILPVSNKKRYNIRSKFKQYRKIDGEYTYLLIDTDTQEKKLTFYLSSEDTIKECIGQCAF